MEPTSREYWRNLLREPPTEPFSCRFCDKEYGSTKGRIQHEPLHIRCYKCQEEGCELLEWTALRGARRHNLSHSVVEVYHLPRQLHQGLLLNSRWQNCYPSLRLLRVELPTDTCGATARCAEEAPKAAETNCQPELNEPLPPPSQLEPIPELDLDLMLDLADEFYPEEADENLLLPDLDVTDLPFDWDQLEVPEAPHSTLELVTTPSEPQARYMAEEDPATLRAITMQDALRVRETQITIHMQEIRTLLRQVETHQMAIRELNAFHQNW